MWPKWHLTLPNMELPASIVLRLAGTPHEQVRSLLHWLRPLTTGTGIGSRVVRDIA